jgi:cytochrome b561
MPTRYSTLQKSLHWLIAILIFWQFISHFIIDRFPKGSPDALPFQASHGLSGMIILVLTLTRLVVRWRRGAPPLPASMDARLRRIANFNHGLLYGVIIGQTTSGMAAGIGQVKAAGLVHGVLSIALFLLVGLHIAAAILHLIKRDGLGSRMFPEPKKRAAQ